jgi:hypothetical protein
MEGKYEIENGIENEDIRPMACSSLRGNKSGYIKEGEFLTS